MSQTVFISAPRIACVNPRSLSTPGQLLWSLDSRAALGRASDRFKLLDLTRLRAKGFYGRGILREAISEDRGFQGLYVAQASCDFYCSVTLSVDFNLYLIRIVA